MRKSYIYILSFGLFVVAAGFLVLKYKRVSAEKKVAFYPLKERRGVGAGTAEARLTQKQFATYMKVAGTNPDDLKPRLSLAALYIQEARITGDYAYYDMAAMRYVNEVLTKEPSHFEALTYQALLNLSQHHFAEGLTIAEKARSANPYNAFVHGILVDANVELGNYPKAVEEAEKMISIRPDLRSYTRVSYLREIHGDYPGAIEAMQMAIEAGAPGDESTEWARVHLANLFALTGDSKSAEMQYMVALERRPGYAYALAGLGHLAFQEGLYTKAIDYYLAADTLVNDLSLKEGLADAYRSAGKQSKADSIMRSVLHDMNEVSAKGLADESVGHYADRELAYAYLKAGDMSKALLHALAEYNRRPANIDVNEAVAWVYYLKKDYAKALPFIETALKTKSKNPTLLSRAGLIYAKNNEAGKARAVLAEAMEQRPFIDPALKTEVTAILQKL